MKKMFILLMMLFAIQIAKTQTLSLLPSDIGTYTNAAAASTIKSNAFVSIKQIGTQGTANTHIELNNSNSTPVLNATGNDAIVIEATADITSLVLTYASNTLGNNATPYVGYNSTVSVVLGNTGTPTISSCELQAGNTTTTQATYTYNVPTGTRHIILVRNKACSPAAADGTTIRISQIDVGYSSAPVAPTVTTTAASSITASTAASGGNVTADGGSAVTARGVCWSTAANPTTADPLTTDGTGTGTFTSSITGLTPGTLYHVRAYATNGIGTSYGADLTFTTTVPTTNYYNVASTDVSVNTNWGTNVDGTGSNPPNFTTAGQIFNLNNSGASLGSALTISGASSKLIIGDGLGAVSFTIPTANSLTAIVDVLNNGTLICQNTTTPTFGTLATGSTVNFDGINVPTANYFNLTLSNGSNFAANAVAGVAGDFNPSTTTTATANSTIVFNGTTFQTIPAFTYDSVAITNAAGVSTPNTTATLNFNRGLKVSNPLTIAANDVVNTKGATASFTIDATKTITVNGQLVLQSLVSPTTAANTLIVNSGAKYVVDANVGNSGGFIPAATTNAVYSTGSEVLILQGAPRIVGTTNGDVTWNSVGSGTMLNNASVSILGTLTINNGAVNLGSGGSGRTLTVNNLVVSGGEFDVLGAPGSGATNQTLNITGNVTVSGGNLYASNGTAGTGSGIINIAGNLNHTSGNFGGAQTAGNSIVNFNGTTAQTISTTGFAGNTSVGINNSNGVTLTSGNIDLGTGTLTFTNGKLTLGANNVTAGTIAGGSASSYAVADAAGALNLTVPASTGTYNLPIGTAANYRPASINFTAAPTVGVLSAKIISGTPSTTGLPLIESGITAPDDNITTAADDAWEVNSTATGGTYDITVTGNGQVGVTDFTKTTLLKKADLASSWTLQGTHVTTTGSNTAPVLSRTGLTSFSIFAIGGGANGILPLSLINFTAAVNNGIVTLNWSTAQESNLISYEIEKSSNGVDYQTIGSVAARNSYLQSNYQFIDAQSNGISYYRLKIKEQNGSFKNSKVIIINASKKVKIALYPNPVTTDIYLSYKKATNNASLQIRGLNGTLLINKAAVTNSTNTTIDVSKLQAGTYLLVYYNGVEVEQEIFVKK